MSPLNFDSFGKFLTSLGVVLFAFGFLWYLGYAWVLDQQTDKYIDTQIELSKLDKDNNSRIQEVDKVMEDKFIATNFLGEAAVYLSKIFTIGGGIIMLMGMLYWYRENHSKKKS